MTTHTTGIQWTHWSGYTGVTWNPTTGCDRVSEGCQMCYASSLHNSRFRSNVKAAVIGAHHSSALATVAEVAREYGDPLPFPDTYDMPFAVVKLHPKRLEKPLHWRKPRCVFVNSMSDLFHEDVPDEFIDRVFAVMRLTPWHQYLVLTKRPERMREYMLAAERRRRVTIALDTVHDLPRAAFVRFDAWADQNKGLPVWPLPNVMLGVSAENQRWADERIPLLLGTPAAGRFVSYEPALGPIDFSQWFDPYWGIDGHYKRLVDAGMFNSHQMASLRRPIPSWLLVGGESGPKARPFDLAWARSAIAQCREAGVPVFIKQLGAKPVGKWHPGGGGSPFQTGDRGRLRDSHGGDTEEWPADLRIRQMPGAEVPA